MDTENTLANMSYEQAMQELETIVRRLEDGNVALEDAITLYERGDQLRKYCEQKLQQAQTRVEKIVEGSTGQITTAPLENN